MPDIFISYSRQDTSKAMELADRLRTRGIEVWIDQTDIGAAASWSKEIVRAIDECKAFVVLLSSNSMASVNVAREVGVASEAGKPMLPVALEDIKLSDDLRYHLSGIQRVAYTQFDAIAQSLETLGVSRVVTRASSERVEIRSAPADLRKSLIVMPFDDLSPTQDNQWFADGLAGELIDSLSHIKSLRILDRKTSLDLRGVRQSVVEIGALFNSRYIVQGSVRKFGEQIKISVSLLDIESGDHLWQKSYKGEMKDIFELQESVATNVVEGLKLHLTNEEKSLIDQRGTENAEAYEFWLKAGEYFDRHTKEGFEHATELSGEAIRRDPNYVRAYVSKANALIALYRSYDPNPSLLDDAERLVEEARKRRPDFLVLYQPLINIQMHRGNLAEAERMAKEWVEKEPDKSSSHFALGFLYMETRQHAKATGAFEAALAIKPNSFPSLANVVSNSNDAGEKEKCAKWAGVALAFIENRLQLHPDDEMLRVERASMLYWTGRVAESLAAARELVDERSPRQVRDGVALYTITCLFSRLGEKQDTLRAFRKSLDAGLRSAHALKEFLADDDLTSLAGTTEYQEVKQMVKNILQEQP
jgi:adenylate cyclase